MQSKCLFSTLALSLFLSSANALTSFDLHNINEVHAQGFTGEGVYVGVIDGGFTEHPLLKANLANVRNNSGWKDYPRHGTAVAGIIAATQSNGESYGIATNAKILGEGSIGMRGGANMFDGFNVKIINNSHTGNFGYLRTFAQGDILVVYASGNGKALSPQAVAQHGIGSASNLGAWLTVGKLNRGQITKNTDGTLVLTTASFENQLCVGASSYCLMAAGSAIQSLNANSGFTTMSGTSVSAPVVSGVAALVAEKYPFLGGKQLADVILSTANNDYTFPKLLIWGNDIIYVDNEKPTSVTDVRTDITAVYGTNIGKNAKINTDLSNVKTYTREEIFGQGIVDAQKAMKGLAEIDINRLSATDVEGGTAFYQLNTKGYNALFENDIDEKKYNTALHQNPNATLQATTGAGFKKQGAGTLTLTGNLNYTGDTIVEGGEIKLAGNATTKTIQGGFQVKNGAILSVATPTHIAKNLNNSGTTHFNAQTQIGQMPVVTISARNIQLLAAGDSGNFTNSGVANINAPITMTQDFDNSGTANFNATLSANNLNNQGTINLANDSSNAEQITLTGQYTQTASAVLNAGYLNIDGSTASNNALKAATYSIAPNSTIIYTPQSAATITRTTPLLLNGLENNLASANVVLQQNGGHALTYTLSAAKNALTVAAVPNVYADYADANESMAKVLRPMSNAAPSADYDAFFKTLNALDFAQYRKTLIDLDDVSHLQHNELLLNIQHQDILEKVVNLQTAAEGVFLRPRFAYLKTAALKTNRVGFEFYANKNTIAGTTSAFFNYDNLTGGDISAQLVSFGAALRNEHSPIGIFGGVRFGFSNNTVKKTQHLKYKATTASIFAGVDKDFVFENSHVIPTFYLDYHHFRQDSFHHAGVSYRGAAFYNNGYSGNKLFARNIHAKNSNFVSANVGVTFKQILAGNWNFNANAFYERRLTPNKLKAHAAFDDFAGEFEQTLKLSQNFFRVGLDLNYETPINANGIGYFASVGVDFEASAGGKDKYRAYGGNIKGGIRF